MPYAEPRLFIGPILATAALMIDSCAPIPTPHKAIPARAEVKFPRKTIGAKNEESNETTIRTDMPIRSNRCPKRSAARAPHPLATAQKLGIQLSVTVDTFLK